MSGFIFKKQIFVLAASFLIFIMTPAILNAENISVAQSREKREKLIEEVKKYIGAPYVRGATGPEAFDCSGLVYTVSHDAIGMQLPRTVKAIYSFVKIIPIEQIEPGDLVFFRTTGDGSVSHVGLYIGKNQFISAVSDGPNTGVILSSLKENYWKTHYAASGKFLPSMKDSNTENNFASIKNDKGLAKKDKKEESGKKAKSDLSAEPIFQDSFMTYSGTGSFTDHLAFAAYTTIDWSVFTEKKIMPNFRGLSSEADIIYRGKVLSPGLGLILRWNYGVSAFQMPVIFSLNAGDFLRVYAGPLLSFGQASCPDSETKIKSCVFPGVLGFSFAFPSFTKGNFKIQLVQDVCYSVYNNMSNAALAPLEAASSGLEFCTGVRVVFPFSIFAKK